MTAQIHDWFIYRDKKYHTASIGLNLETFGLTPTMSFTACRRGYIAEFGLKNGRLVLMALAVNNDMKPNKEIPSVNGIAPRIIGQGAMVSDFKGFMDFEYNDINLPINFTGSILITDKFLKERYVHMGYQDPKSYRVVIELKFKDGLLKSTRDLSRKMAREREKDDDFYRNRIPNWFQLKDLNSVEKDDI